MRILQIALITQKGNVFNIKMQIDEIVFESKEEVREKLISVFAINNSKGVIRVPEVKEYWQIKKNLFEIDD